MNEVIEDAGKKSDGFAKTALSVGVVLAIIGVACSVFYGLKDYEYFQQSPLKKEVAAYSEKDSLFHITTHGHLETQNKVIKAQTDSINNLKERLRVWRHK